MSKSEVLRQYGVPLDRDYFKLSQYQKECVLLAARECDYRYKSPIGHSVGYSFFLSAKKELRKRHL